MNHKFFRKSSFRRIKNLRRRTYPIIEEYDMILIGMDKIWIQLTVVRAHFTKFVDDIACPITRRNISLATCDSNELWFFLVEILSTW